MSKNLEMTVLLDFYGQFLTKKQRDTMELYYYEDLSLAEISEHEKITRQGVHDSIRRSELILKDYEEKLCLAERFSLLKKSLEEIISQSDEISNSSELGKIHKCSCNIKDIAEKISESI